MECQGLRELEERHGGVGEAAGAPFGCEPVDEVVVSTLGCDLSPEVVEMRPNSIVALVGLGGDHCDHLTVSSTERGLAEHGGAVQPHRLPETLRVLALHRHDVPQPATGGDALPIQAFEQPIGVLGVDHVYMCHDA